MKFNKLFSAVMLFAVFLYLIAAVVQNKVYAANAVSGANTGTGSGTNANIKKIEEKLDNALMEIQAIKNK